MQLRSGELGTWLGCGEPGGKGPGAEQMAGTAWTLPFCTGSEAAKDREGRRLMLAPLSSEDTWLDKAGVPGKEGTDCGHSPLSSVAHEFREAYRDCVHPLPGCATFCSSLGTWVIAVNGCGPSTPLPEEVGEEGEMRVSDRSCKPGSGGGSSGPECQGELISSVGTGPPGTLLFPSPVLHTWCSLTWAQRVQNSLVILRDVQP